MALDSRLDAARVGAQRPVSTQIDRVPRARRRRRRPERALRRVGGRATTSSRTSPRFARGRDHRRRSCRPTSSPRPPPKSARSARLQRGRRPLHRWFRRCPTSARRRSSPAAGATAARRHGSSRRATTRRSSPGLQGAGIKVIPVDVFSLFAEIRANPAAYGFTNTTGIACGPFPPITTTRQLAVLPAGEPRGAQCRPDLPLRRRRAPDHAHAQRSSRNFVESLIDGPDQYALLAEGAAAHARGHMRALARRHRGADARTSASCGVFVARRSAATSTSTPAAAPRA